MALDGIFLSCLKKELKDKLIDGKVEKIYQHSREELTFVIRTKLGSYKLFMSARANSPRINITEHILENPKTPPMLCMLFRKKLCGARLIDIKQMHLERILFLDFDATDEIGDKTRFTLAVEIMGKHSNIILLDENRRIVDSLKRVGSDISSKRLVLPGIEYKMPPAQDKKSILEVSADSIACNILEKYHGSGLDKDILMTIQGVSPIVCREIEYNVFKNINIANQEEALKYQKEKLVSQVKLLSDIAKNNLGIPYMIKDLDGKPLDFSFIEINQYLELAELVKYETFSRLLDDYYFEYDRFLRIRSREHDLIKFINSYIERLNKKIGIQYLELQKSTKKDYTRTCADLINANLYRINKGMTHIELENFYDLNNSVISIKLDPLLSPSENAQKYYKDYKKLKTAEIVLKEQISYAKKELVYMESILDLLNRAETEDEILTIKQELIEQGYIKKHNRNIKNNKLNSLKPLEFKSSNGFKILVGRNNKQNDYLTLKQSSKNDIWFHVKDIPGSHTIMYVEGKKPQREDLMEAACISSYYSKARQSSQVPVDYTFVKNVSKPSGAKPGMVIYVNNKTIFTNPDFNIVEKLKI